jgi:RsiW-degrading membrane proteinase PrsW (M82 family)
MAAAIDDLFHSATADQARATCSTYHIAYLVARVYDPVWQNKQSWVWTLTPVVSNPEFRALDCGGAP